MQDASGRGTMETLSPPGVWCVGVTSTVLQEPGRLLELTQTPRTKGSASRDRPLRTTAAATGHRGSHSFTRLLNSVLGFSNLLI